MKLIMKGKLIDIIKRIGQFENDTILFVKERKEVNFKSETFVYHIDKVEDLKITEFGDISYFLEIEDAKEAIKVWKKWTNNERFSPEELCDAVIYYAEYDAFMPIDDD